MGASGVSRIFVEPQMPAGHMWTVRCGIRRARQHVHRHVGTPHHRPRFGGFHINILCNTQESWARGIATDSAQRYPGYVTRGEARVLRDKS